MKNLFILFSFLWLVSCTKKDEASVAQKTTHEFFSSNEQALEEVRNSERSFKTNEQVLSIQHISYLQEPKREHAIVFYKTPKGDRSVIVSRDLGGAKELSLASYTKCEGASCDCYINAIIHNDGTLDMSCSCSSCRMVTTFQSVLPEQ